MWFRAVKFLHFLFRNFLNLSLKQSRSFKWASLSQVSLTFWTPVDINVNMCPNEISWFCNLIHTKRQQLTTRASTGMVKRKHWHRGERIETAKSLSRIRSTYQSIIDKPLVLTYPNTYTIDHQDFTFFWICERFFRFWESANDNPIIWQPCNRYFNPKNTVA